MHRVLISIGLVFVAGLLQVAVAAPIWQIDSPDAGDPLSIASNATTPIPCEGKYWNRLTTPTIELWRDISPPEGDWLAESGAWSTGILTLDEYEFMPGCGEWTSQIHNGAEEWTASPQDGEEWIPDHALELAGQITQYDWEQYYEVH
jgi:hypothetical protein